MLVVFDDECRFLEHEIADCINSTSLQQLKVELDRVKDRNMFGEVLCSGYGVIEYRRMRMNNDWAITTVDSVRVGKNRVSFPIRLDRSWNKWKLRDYGAILFQMIGLGEGWD